ncbi:hypothetical protein [Acinetobacter rathckeae]|uniref:hypothetical protein n=1 Tax=Acinetobacter rathckeae TaxID=2605272 RepID=UPI001BB2F925|nr:hypothetical protein [Acinetobacter rathckeae]MBF7687057.1 hypothetical protein [Acinetobacter rathckeae]
MKLKTKMRSNRRCRHQRSMYAMRKDKDRPEGATHFDPRHNVYYKQENGQWFYFENGWGESWEKVMGKVDLELEVLV